VSLQFESAGSPTWRPMGSTTIGAGGGFSFHPRLTRSGVLEIVPSSGATAASPHNVSATSSASGSASSPTTDDAPLAPSAAEPVQVDARLSVSAKSRDVLAGSPVSIRGRLLSGSRGSLVRLMTRRGAGWTTLASTHTGPAGGFDLRYVVPSTGRSWVRVAFAGDQDNGATWAHAGELVGLRQSVVSWYDDGGDTACGFHATYGVASRTLPCGTQVTFVYDGRSVTATVDDRGPYVYSRDYDLNQNTAAALGVSGVATVLSSI
jgi:rare lipoprotein A